ncbi:MAG TPA: YceI family protein [Burkholderiales bacterium]|jgi:Uncharacterized conserved protein
MKKLALLAILASAFSVSAMAAPKTYVLDADHTFPRFEYTHFGFSTQLSRFDKTTGAVIYDKEAKTGSVDVTIDMKSVNTGSTLFNEHIQAADFLDTANFPTATFKSTKVRFDGDRPTTIDGVLTIKGIAKPVTLKLTSFKSGLHPVAKKEAIGADATTTIKRSDFNTGKYAPHVGDDLTLIISLEAFAQ